MMEVDRDIVASLRQSAQASARASQMLADAKSARNQAAGDLDAHYLGLTAEQTIEWKAADQIERLRAALARANDPTWQPPHKR